MGKSCLELGRNFYTGCYGHVGPDGNDSSKHLEKSHRLRRVMQRILTHTTTTPAAIRHHSAIEDRCRQLCSDGSGSGQRHTFTGKFLPNRNLKIADCVVGKRKNACMRRSSAAHRDLFCFRTLTACIQCARAMKIHTVETNRTDLKHIEAYCATHRRDIRLTTSTRSYQSKHSNERDRRR